MNNEKDTKKYFDKWQNIKLSETSRARIEGDLLEYAQFHSTKEGVRVSEDGRSIAQVPQRTSLLNLFKPKSMTAAIIAILLVAGGGTSYAAEGAVPGDFLYTVKVDINENVKSAFAISNEAEAALQARLAEERLEEAQELAARGELTADASADIQTRLKAHYTEAEERSNKSEADGDYESSATVRASLEGSFRTYVDVLTDLNTQVSGNNGILLITDIRTYADAAANAQATATVDVSVDAKADIEATIKRAENLLAGVEAKMQRAKANISVKAYARIEARYDQGIQAIADAKTHLRAELYREAYTSVQMAIRTASEVDAMINSVLRIQADVDVRINSVIDTATDIRTNTDAVVDTRSDSDTQTESDAKSDTRTTSDMNDDAHSGSEVDARADIEVEVITDTPILDSTTRAGASIDAGAGATNATDYNSSRSNKSY